MADDIKRVACNLRITSKTAKKSAIAFVLNPNFGNACERISIIVRSQNGRWIEKWEAGWRLGNFRAKTVVPVDPVYERVMDGMQPTFTGMQLLNERTAEYFSKHYCPLEPR